VFVQTTRSVVRKESARSKKLERVVKGFANHRRIEMLELLKRQPELSLGEIACRLDIDLKTASEHLRRLAIAGLVLKRNAGREVRHGLTPRSENILTFLRMLE
jgi:DNA-binding transcriptional ArsR family regulator